MRAPTLNSVERASAVGALPPGVHVLERGWLSSNNVVFEEGDRLAVVDTGYVVHSRQTAALIDHIGRGRPLARIVNTHLHSDHVGGNARLARGAAVSILIPAGGADAVRSWDVERLSYRATEQRWPRFGFDGLLRAGDVLELAPCLAGIDRGRPRSPHADAVRTGATHPDIGRCTVGARLRRAVSGDRGRSGLRGAAPVAGYDRSIASCVG